MTSRSLCCPPANATDERLHYMPLYREQFVVALPQEHALAEKNGVQAERSE